MQIIINRIAIICETQDVVTRLKWGTAIVMTAINIAVFCIVSSNFVDLGRASKLPKLTPMMFSLFPPTVFLP